MPTDRDALHCLSVFFHSFVAQSVVLNSPSSLFSSSFSDLLLAFRDVFYEEAYSCSWIGASWLAQRERERCV